MPKYKLSVGAQKLIETAIDNLFEKAKIRFLGAPNDKRLIVTATPDFSLPGLFMAAAKNHGLKGNTETLQDLLRIAGLYIDGTKEKTKALTIKTIQSTLATAKKNKKAPEPMRNILERELSQVWETAQNQMKTIAEVEAQTAKNMSVLDGIMHVNAENSIEDPVVYFIPVKDKDLCDECRRLHLMGDDQTPRLWYMSEIGHGYHKKGDSNPKMGGLHPHCRCSLLTMLPGYSFDKSGNIQFLQRGWVEIDYQRGVVPVKPGRQVAKLKKDEEPLQKAEWYWKNLKRKFEDFGWEQVEGAKHTKMVNPYLPGEPWVTIKRGHMNGPIDPEAVDSMYAKPMGLRVRHSGTDVEVDPKHPHAHHYKKLGLWDGNPEGPTPVASWTPETAHQHVHIDSIEHSQVPAKDAWKPAMWHKKMKDEPHKVPPVKLRRLPGGEKYQVVEGQDRIEGAKLSEFNHVPAEVVK